ncbi:MAG: GAF domain-containing protein [bacterium]|nr:GAF domain-containing protein [bacterium]
MQELEKKRDESEELIAREETDYELLLAQMDALAEGVEYEISNLANAAALLADSLSDVNWAGFYVLFGEELCLGPFVGKPACTKIAVGRGVCGTAVKEARNIRVEDVHDFAGHIACDAASRSEVVLPIWKGERIWGVLDIDSPQKARFSERDEEGLSQFVHALEHILFGKSG